MLFSHICSRIYLKISWKKKLMNKFKNLHRTARARTSGIALNDASSTKRAKLSDDAGNTPPTSSAIQEYQHRKKNLYCSKKWIYSSLCSLMDEMYGMFFVNLEIFVIKKNLV